MRQLLSVLFSTLQGGVRGGLLFVAIFSTSTLWAYDFQSGDLYYNITSSSEPYTVEVTSSYAYSSENYSGLTAATIPDIVTHNGTIYSVTSIGKSAFEYCSSLTAVTIPNSVTSIRGGAFSSCSKLTKTNYTGDIAGWCNIKFGNYSANPMYYSHNFYINDQEIKDLVIPNSVTNIGNYAFEYCSSLTSVTIPNSVTNIGYDAFYECSSLTSVTIGESVTSIGSSAFEDCSKLTKTNYTGDIAGWCNIKFGNGLANPMYCSHNFYINDQEIKDLVIPNSVTSIGSYAFIGCSGLTSVTIPNSVTTIGGSAFCGCSSLTSVTIPNSVTSIGSWAFGDCYSLTSVVIPNSVTNIGENAFSSCSSLTSVTIPNSVTNIGYGAFYECYSLTKTNYTGDIAGWCNIKFGDVFANPMYYSHNFYINDQEIKDLVIPNSVTSIGEDAFSGCSSLTSVTIGESVTSIGDDAFSGCSSLTSVTIPNSVTNIGDYAFEYCSSLTSVTIPNSVTSIGSYAFYYCSSLTSITCEAITPPTIGEDAFYGVSSSTPVYVPCGCEEAYKTASGWKDFTNIQEPLLEYSIEVYVNDTIMGTAKVNYNTFCEGAQISASPNIGYHFVQWNDGNTENPRTLELTQDTILTAEFAQSFFGQCGDNLYWSYDETAKTISITGSGNMYDYTADTQPWLLFKEQIVEVTTTNTVTSIGTSAFEGCVRLGKISLGTGLEKIAANAFAGCTRLYDIYVYATYPPFAEESSFANYNVYVYIPCEYQRDYTLDVVWGNFKFIECIESEDVTTDGVIITPSTNDVTITWPTETGADSYTIVIKKDGEVFCTLTFNADGQLLNIAFAPSRDGNNRPVQYAEQTTNGYRFTVTGLEEGTHYAYNIDVKDAADKTIKSYTGEFTTESTTAVENTHSQSPIINCQKIIRDNQLLILRDDKTYTIMGAEIK